MTRYLFGFIYVLALGVMPMVGCSESSGDGGNGVACVNNVCPCTEAGIRAAIAEGGGPFTFDCDGPTTVVTEAEIVIDNNVILDGEGNLMVEVDEPEARVVRNFAEAALRGLTVRGALWNHGILTLEDSAVVGRVLHGSTQHGEASLSLVRSTVSGAVGVDADGIEGIDGEIKLTNSTVSGNQGDGISSFGTINVVNSTVSGNGRAAISGCDISVAHSTIVGDISRYDAKACDYRLTVAASLISGECSSGSAVITDNGYNVESPRASCIAGGTKSIGYVLPVDLQLGDLQDNGGPTSTHALLPGSIALDRIPEAECLDADGEPLTTDQRGEPRPGGAMCDVGAFEVQP